MDEMRQYVDADNALERVRGNKTLYKTLLGSFLQNDHFDELRQRIREGDADAAARAAHAIKGLAANLSLPALYETTLAMEQKFKTGEIPQDALPQLEEARDKTRRRVESVLSALS
ncbi:MAG: Hpt domain-containing protein [Oscillospiraceae bacterium]|jgi:HPt (histidine-containing phosphotransfer) domain-containing protein|nr:Hpt domain-containing protein [Oscillospiraceae bacterium]